MKKTAEVEFCRLGRFVERASVARLETKSAKVILLKIYRRISEVDAAEVAVLAEEHFALLERSFNELSFDERSLNELALNELAFNELSFNELAFNELSTLHELAFLELSTI